MVFCCSNTHTIPKRIPLNHVEAKYLKNALLSHKKLSVLKMDKVCERVEDEQWVVILDVLCKRIGAGIGGSPSLKKFSFCVSSFPIQNIPNTHAAQLRTISSVIYPLLDFLKACATIGT